MKTLIFIAILFLNPFFSYSQWITTGQNVYNFGNVGINDSIPGTALTVKGKVQEDAVIKIENDYSSSIFSYAAGDMPFFNASFVMNRSRGTMNLPITLSEGDRIGGLFARPFIDGQYRRSAAIHMYVGENPGINSYPVNIRFETTGTNEIERSERMRIEGNGNIGIGTSEPKARLEVAEGDVFISDIERGIIMKSPDGNCWRGTLDNTGSLNFTQIDCPQISVTQEVQDLKATDQVSVFPNPAKDEVYINIEDNGLKKSTYVIVDMTGKKLEQGKINSNNQLINTASLAPGLYLISIRNNKGSVITTKKIIKE